MDWHTLKEAVLSLYDKLHLVQTEYFHLWRGSILFTWRWWLALAMLIIPWIVWFAVRKRESSGRLLCAGGIIASLSMLMDQAGVTMHLWTYPTTVAPMMPSFLPFDLSAVPVATMLFLQFFPRMKLFWKALIYAAGGTLFDFISDSIGLSVQEGWGWSSIYTFLILFFMYLLAYRIAHMENFEPIDGNKVNGAA